MGMRRLLSLPFTVASTVSFAFPVIGLSFLNRQAAFSLARLWSRSILAEADVRLEVEGREHLVPGPVIVMANHQSLLDIPVLFLGLPYEIRFVAKNELRYVPVLGQGMKAMGHLFVDRSNHAQATTTLNNAAAEIRSGTSIAVFPEGTRTTDGRLLPFKKGGFVLAIKSGVPIVPVTIVDSIVPLPKGAMSIRAGTIHLRIHQPIETRDYTLETKDALMEAVRTAIESGL